MFVLLKSHKDFIDFIKSVENKFDCPESFEELFGFTRNFDDEGNILETIDEYDKEGKEFKSEPESYPCVVYFCYESGRDRFGNNKLVIYDKLSLKDEELGGDYKL